MSFDLQDIDSENNENIFKGVEVLNDMFGMTTASSNDGNSGICMK